MVDGDARLHAVVFIEWKTSLESFFFFFFKVHGILQILWALLSNVQVLAVLTCFL
jgi:hypothetical protein